MGAPQVRPARREDEAELARIDRLTWTPDVSPAPVPALNEPFFGARTAVEDVLTAELDGRVAGYVKIGPVTNLSASSHVLEVTGLAVDPDCQGRGLGRALIRAAIDTAVERGARRLMLRVLGSNARARALYVSCGFETEGVMRELFLLEGRYVDDVIMGLDLL